MKVSPINPQDLIPSELGRDGFFLVKKYFQEHEHLFKLIGFSIAIAGLFLNLGSNDENIRRLIAFFLLLTFFLISFFILKSLFKLHSKEKSPELYKSIILIPTYVGGVLIYNLFTYLIVNFLAELYFYLHVIGVPLIIVGANLLFIAFFKLISTVKKIDGNQLENFFLLTLNLSVLLIYSSNQFSFSKTFYKFISFDFLTLNLIYLFLLVILSEWRPFNGKSKKSAWIETFVFLFLIILPLILNYGTPLVLNGF